MLVLHQHHNNLEPAELVLTSTFHPRSLSLQVSAGEPLTLNYGTLSNDLLFLDYGFVVPDNLHDRVDVQFQVSLLQVRGLKQQSATTIT